MGIDIEQIGAPDRPRGGGLKLAAQRRAATVGTFLAVIWITWAVNGLLFGGRLLNLGIFPRRIGGLVGIVTAPFLHANLGHLWSNTLGILVLGGLLIVRNEGAFWVVSIFGALAAGVGTWIIGRGDAVHVGASGVIFAYFGYLLFAGVFERRIGSMFLSVVVFLVWGGMLWSVLPGAGAGVISWEGHLCGLAGGALSAKLLAGERRTPEERLV